MKNFRNMMLIAFVAVAMVSLPQESQAQERRPKEQIEKREKKEQKNRERAMRDKDFSMMYKIVKKSSFDDKKIDIIRVASIGSYFSSRQCAELLSLISFNDNRLEALEVMAPRIVDDKDFDRIMKLFSLSYKDKVARILSRR